MSAFEAMVREELTKARSFHTTPIRSIHEGYAVILEEVEELQAECFDRHKPVDRILKELIQVAAMCQRMAEDLSLDEDRWETS